MGLFLSLASTQIHPFSACYLPKREEVPLLCPPFTIVFCLNGLIMAEPKDHGLNPLKP